MRSWLLVLLGVLVSAVIVVGLIFTQKIPLPTSKVAVTTPFSSPTPVLTVIPTPLPSTEVSTLPSPSSSPDPSLATTNMNPDLSVDSSGLSKATVLLNTTQGLVKFKFYSNDAPKTVKRIVELINKGFYNGLAFHRVIPGFVVQGGDPTGTGAGGSGQKLSAEFNDRKHIEGAIAMARASDQNSADSQFYISLGVHAHLDHSYTVFGQVIEGMDVVKKIKVGDKMTSLIIQ